MRSPSASLLFVSSIVLLSCTDSGTNPTPVANTPAPVPKADTTAAIDTTAKPPVAGMVIGEAGYVTSGSWKGYAWTAAIGTGSLVTPADFKTVKAGQTKFCAKGTVGKDPAYGGVVMVGINLNQVSLPPTGAVEPPILDYTPTGTGIRYKVSNPGATTLRIQIQDKSGTAAGRWCADISGETSGFLPWEEFNTTCWSPATGKSYNKEPLKDVSVVVPGKNTQDVPAEFCVEQLSEEP